MPIRGHEFFIRREFLSRRFTKFLHNIQNRTITYLVKGIITFLVVFLKRKRDGNKFDEVRF